MDSFDPGFAPLTYVCGSHWDYDLRVPIPRNQICPNCVEYTMLCRAWTQESDRSVRCLLAKHHHERAHLSDDSRGQRFAWIPEGWNPYH